MTVKQFVELIEEVNRLEDVENNGTGISRKERKWLDKQCLIIDAITKHAGNATLKLVVPQLPPPMSLQAETAYRLLMKLDAEERTKVIARYEDEGN